MNEKRFNDVLKNNNDDVDGNNNNNEKNKETKGGYNWLNNKEYSFYFLRFRFPSFLLSFFALFSYISNKICSNIFLVSFQKYYFQFLFSSCSCSYSCLLLASLLLHFVMHDKWQFHAKLRCYKVFLLILKINRLLFIEPPLLPSSLAQNHTIFLTFFLLLAFFSAEHIFLDRKNPIIMIISATMNKKVEKKMKTSLRYYLCNSFTYSLIYNVW